MKLIVSGAALADLDRLHAFLADKNLRVAARSRSCFPAFAAAQSGLLAFGAQSQSCSALRSSFKARDKPAPGV
jgi:hypothetical protein